ncbi:MAG: Asd/ArgC dimerization domain-containing protein [Thermoanaerobaculia bacterium]
MSHVAIVGSTTLLGREVRDLLDRRRELAEKLTLLAASEEEVGAVTEARGRAALVSAADPEALEGVDLLFACGDVETDLPIVARRPAGVTAILLSRGAGPEHGRPVVSGIEGAGLGPGAGEAGEVLVSPHPGAILLAYLMAPLAGLAGGVEGAAATVIQPVSMLGDPGLEGLLGQTRDILAMTGERRESVFERQLAFNLYPTPGGSAGLPELVRATTGFESPLAIQVLQAPVFHGLACSLSVRFGSDPGEEALRRALETQRHVALTEADAALGTLPGPVESAARGDVLVGSARPDPSAPGTYWVWAVLDNLTRGGALNAIEVAEALSARV